MNEILGREALCFLSRQGSDAAHAWRIDAVCAVNTILESRELLRMLSRSDQDL